MSGLELRTEEALRQAVEEHLKAHPEELSDPSEAVERQKFFVETAKKFAVDTHFVADAYAKVSDDLHAGLLTLTTAHNADALATSKKATQAAALKPPTQSPSISIAGQLRAVQVSAARPTMAEVAPIPPPLALGEQTLREWQRTAPNAPLAERTLPDDGTFEQLKHRLLKVSEELDAIKPVRVSDKTVTGVRFVDTLFTPADIAEVRESLKRALADAENIEKFRQQNQGRLPYAQYVAFAVRYDVLAPIREIREAFANLPPTNGLPDVTIDLRPGRARPQMGYQEIMKTIRATTVPEPVQHLLNQAPEKIVWVTQASMSKADYLQAYAVEGLFVGDKMVAPFDALSAAENSVDIMTPYIFAVEHDLNFHTGQQDRALDLYAIARQTPQTFEADPVARRNQARAAQNAILGRLTNAISHIPDERLRLTVQVAAFFIKREIDGVMTVANVRTFLSDLDKSGFIKRIANPIDLGGDFPAGVTPDIKGMTTWLEQWAASEAARGQR